ncbi:protein kinase [Streptomyces sp. NPDC002088]|uniref:serine/threonine-protein kinase n=1 Tax=Streptomyces sp. NPDC002088 TaxID=3154665 RepID=UPI00331C4A22
MVTGRYRLVESIGQGGMGRVWRAVDEMLDRLVAVKEMRIDGLDAEDTRTRRERTLREARATARIDHPQVVRVYDVVDEGERLWIVMELVAGRSLERVMVEDGPLSPRETARIGLGLVAALRQVHAGGVLHRDIKPGNVLVETGGRRVVLTDFGIAAIQDAKALTMVGMLVGSPDYMAPERISGRRQGPPSDVWSLGATLCAALGGRSPFSRDTTLATLHAVLYEEPELPAAAGPLRDILAALLEKDPSARPSLQDVESALQPVAYPAPESGPLSPPAPVSGTPSVSPSARAHPPAPEPQSGPLPGSEPQSEPLPGSEPQSEPLPGSEPQSEPLPSSEPRYGPLPAPDPQSGPLPAPEAPSGATPVPAPDPEALPRRQTPVSEPATRVLPWAPGEKPTPAFVDAPRDPRQPAPAPVQDATPPQSPAPTEEARPAPALHETATRTEHTEPPAPRTPNSSTERSETSLSNAMGTGVSLARAQAETERRPVPVPGPGELPGPVRPSTPARGGRRRTAALVAAVGVVTAGAVVGIVLATASSPDDTGADTSAPSASPQTSVSASAPTGTPSSTVEGTYRPPSLPPGAHQEAGGFAWVTPKGWRRDVKTGAEVHYTSPDGKQELVAKSSLARGDLMDTWQTSEQNAHQGQGYRKIRLEETTFRGNPAVVWEYTFTLQGTQWHASLLGFNANGKSYQINTWYQPEIEPQAVKTYNQVKDDFTVL